MLTIEIPGRPTLNLEHLVLDLNGTIAKDGTTLPGVGAGLMAIRSSLTAVVLTADTLGRAETLRESLGVEVHVIPAGGEAAAKLAYVQQLGPEKVVAIGNGANDAQMLRAAALGIVVIGPEGCAVRTLAAADVIVANIADALGLLAKPIRLIATLRE